jgi:hypothetical protein
MEAKLVGSGIAELTLEERSKRKRISNWRLMLLREGNCFSNFSQRDFRTALRNSGIQIVRHKDK